MKIANSVPIIDDFDNQSSEIEIDPAKTGDFFSNWYRSSREL